MTDPYFEMCSGVDTTLFSVVFGDHHKNEESGNDDNAENDSQV